MLEPSIAPAKKDSLETNGRVIGKGERGKEEQKSKTTGTTRLSILRAPLIQRICIEIV
jgi:hypothetical protein